MRRTLQSVLIAVACCLGTAPALAATYWVNAAGTTASNCGNTAANGCTTWLQLMSGSSTCGAGGCAGTVVGGDTVRFVSGTYTGNGGGSGIGIPWDGSVGNVVTVECTDSNGTYAPGTCTINGVSASAAFCGTVVIGSNTSTTSCSSNQATHVRLRGLVIKRGPSANNPVYALLSQVGSHDMVIEDCTIDGEHKDALLVNGTSKLTFRRNTITNCIPTNGIGCAIFGYPQSGTEGITNTYIVDNAFHMEGRGAATNVDCATVYSPVTSVFEGNTCTGAPVDGMDMGMLNATSPQPFRYINRYNVTKFPHPGGGLTSRAFTISGQCDNDACAATTRTKAIAFYKNVVLAPDTGTTATAINTYGGAEFIDTWYFTVFSTATQGNGSLFWNDCQFGGRYARDNQVKYNIFASDTFAGTADAIIPGQHAGTCLDACGVGHRCPWVGNQLSTPNVSGNIAALWPTGGSNNQFTAAQFGTTFNSCTDCTAQGNTGNVASNPTLTNRTTPMTLGNMVLQSGSNAIDQGAAFCTTTNAGTGATVVNVTCLGSENDPRHWFPASSDYYLVDNTDCRVAGVRAVDYSQSAVAGCFDVQVGTCLAQVSSATSTSLTLASACTWGIGDKVHVPFSGAAPDRGAIEFIPTPTPAGPVVGITFVSGPMGH